VGQKSDTARTYITLYERYHFFGPPGIATLPCEIYVLKIKQPSKTASHNNVVENTCVVI